MKRKLVLSMALERLSPPMPADFEQKTMRMLKDIALRKEETVVKAKISIGLVVAITLVLLTAGIALALTFSSQVTEFFGNLYGNDMRAWLEKGDVASVNQSFVLDDVEFTLDEVVYRENGLYGIGTIRPQEGSSAVIIPEDHNPDEPFGYDKIGEGGTPEKAPADAPSIADAARERNSKLLVVRALPDQIGVDGGEMLSPGSVGYTLVPQRDGSIRFSFELSDANAVEKGQKYTIKMWASVCEMTLDGKTLDDTRHGENWTVEITPEPISEASPAALEPAAPTQTSEPESLAPEADAPLGMLPTDLAAASNLQDIDQVIKLQTALQGIGYLATVSHTYGEDTIKAVADFQKDNGLSSDGIAGESTQELLYSGNAKPASIPLPELEEGAGIIEGPDKSQVQLLHWFDTVKPSVKEGQTCLVLDPASKRSWTLQFSSLDNHADLEPLTLRDTQIMNAAFGNKATWTPKPVYVRLPDGRWTLAATNNTPQSIGSITGNGFDGYLCMHFLRDMAETRQNTPDYGVANQDVIRAAWLDLTGETYAEIAR
jgi:hypothetical protein